MTPVPLSRLPDDARAWAFGSTRPLAPEEMARVEEALAPFLERWTAHGAALRAGFEVREGWFVLVAVDENDAAASGCSIDALVGRLRGLEEELGLELLDTAPVWYREEGGIACVSRGEFRELAARGRVGPDTPVFDLSVTRLGEVRPRAWERPAEASWHATLLSGAPAGAKADGGRA